MTTQRPLLLLLLLGLALAQAGSATPGHGSSAVQQQHHPAATAGPTFTITVNDFMKDGAPFRILSGSVHYWRSRPEDWKGRLQLAKKMGVNAITFYVGWWLHEPEDGTFDFTCKATPASHQASKQAAAAIHAI